MSAEDKRFEGYSYRTSSRFGSRVHVAIGGGTVSVTGPRVPLPIYRQWIAPQAVFLMRATEDAQALAKALQAA